MGLADDIMGHIKADKEHARRERDRLAREQQERDRAWSRPLTLDSLLTDIRDSWFDLPAGSHGFTLTSRAYSLSRPEGVGCGHFIRTLEALVPKSVGWVFFQADVFEEPGLVPNFYFESQTEDGVRGYRYECVWRMDNPWKFPAERAVIYLRERVWEKLWTEKTVVGGEVRYEDGYAKALQEHELREAKRQAERQHEERIERARESGRATGRVHYVSQDTCCIVC